MFYFVNLGEERQYLQICNFLICPLPLSPKILSPGSFGIGTGGGGGGGGALLGQSGQPDNKHITYMANISC